MVFNVLKWIKKKQTRRTSVWVRPGRTSVWVRPGTLAGKAYSVPFRTLVVKSTFISHFIAQMWYMKERTFFLVKNWSVSSWDTEILQWCNNLPFAHFRLATLYVFIEVIFNAGNTVTFHAKVQENIFLPIIYSKFLSCNNLWIFYLL